MRLNDSSQGVIHHVAKIRKILQVEQIAKLILNATQKNNDGVENLSTPSLLYQGMLIS